jgi:uncharacterized protein DUF732
MTDNEAATEVGDTIAATPADLAWSDESATAERSSRDWRGYLRWAAVVALLCSTVVAVVWFSAMLYRQQWSRPAVSTAPTTSATVARPPFTVAPPAATVTVTPAPAPPVTVTAQAPAPAQFSATDQLFLAALRGAGISIPTADAAEYAIVHAHAVCDYMAKHPHDDAAAANYVAATTIWGRSAGEFAQYSAVNYCPQYASE